MKSRYNKKNKVKLVDIKVGDWCHRREINPTTIKGPWEPIPFQIIGIHHNQITGMRQGQVSTRDRNDWKLLVARPAHLNPFQYTPAGHGPTKDDARPGGAMGGYTEMLSEDDNNIEVPPHTRAQARRKKKVPTTPPPTPAVE